MEVSVCYQMPRYQCKVEWYSSLDLI